MTNLHEVSGTSAVTLYAKADLAMTQAEAREAVRGAYKRAVAALKPQA